MLNRMFCFKIYHVVGCIHQEVKLVFSTLMRGHFVICYFFYREEILFLYPTSMLEDPCDISSEHADFMKLDFID